MTFANKGGKMSNKSGASETPESEVIKRPDKIVASVPKEAFKAMFYLFAGRPDSKTKLFRRKVSVTPDELYYINDMIAEKLKLHQIDQVVTTATIKFSRQEILQFGTWAEFRDFNWRIAHVTQEVSVRWDFMIKIDDYGVPQRHTLVMKLSGAPNPRDIFQMLMSQDIDDDDIEGKLGMCVARVDFISHRLADELIDVIAKWNESLKESPSTGNWFVELDKYDTLIARSINFSIPIMFALVAVLFAAMLIPATDDSLTAQIYLNGLRWLLISGLSLFVITRLSKYLAGKCYSAINEYGTFTPFQLTNGDRNLLEKHKKTNNSKIRAFAFNCGSAIILNILAGIAVYHLLKW